MKIRKENEEYNRTICGVVKTKQLGELKIQNELRLKIGNNWFLNEENRRMLVLNYVFTVIVLMTETKRNEEAKEKC